MLERVSFILGAAACLGSVPILARADEGTREPPGSPSPAPAKQSRTPKPRETEPPHVHGPNGLTSIPENKPVEWTMEVLDGPRFRLSDYRGKVVMCNLFATWCGPCNVEQPGLVAFARAHTDDTAVIGINMWEEDNLVREYRKKYAIPYPIAMQRNKGLLPDAFRQQRLAFPTTIVFRPNGRLSCAWDGDVNGPWFEVEREHALSDGR
jgi:thiol-disulfide isomerase/thioredoxin